MNKQELRRLGVLPYEENDTTVWMPGQRRDMRGRRFRRRPPEGLVEIIRTEDNLPSRRLQGGWTMRILEEATESMEGMISDAELETITAEISSLGDMELEPDDPDVVDSDDVTHGVIAEPPADENPFRRLVRYFRL